LVLVLILKFGGELCTSLLIQSCLFDYKLSKGAMILLDLILNYKRLMVSATQWKQLDLEDFT